MRFWDSSALVPLLAAAFVVAEGRPASLPFVTLDGRLAIAARREGFPVLDREAL
jgi:hypothetical protein